MVKLPRIKLPVTNNDTSDISYAGRVHNNEEHSNDNRGRLNISGIIRVLHSLTANYLFNFYLFIDERERERERERDMDLAFH